MKSLPEDTDSLDLNLDNNNNPRKDIPEKFDWEAFDAEHPNKINIDSHISGLDEEYDIFDDYDALKEHEVLGVVTEVDRYSFKVCISVTGESVTCDNHYDDIEIGEILPIFIDIKNKTGFYFFLPPKRQRQTAWKLIRKSMDCNDCLEVLVKEHVDGGYNVLLYGMNAFLPDTELEAYSDEEKGTLEGQFIKIRVIRARSDYDIIIVSTNNMNKMSK